MKKSKQPTVWIPITWVDPAGNVVKGAYSIDKTDWMTVRMEGGGEKSARGGPAASSIASIMLGELYRETGPRSTNH